MAVDIAPARPLAAGDVAAAVQIGNRSTSTLGLLPTAAYEQAAREQTLLLARVDGEIVGYALYGLARRRVRLTHLCVAQEHRGEGIARQLIEEISKRHAGYTGIHARCRHDYNLGEMWIKLGFSPISEQSGRGKDRRVLVNWWRDHGHPNLLTRLDEEVLVRAAVDLNILRDLAQPQRPDARDARSLVDDQISDRLELVRTAALDAEIVSINGELRRQCTIQAQGMRSVRGTAERSAQVSASLLNTVRRRAMLGTCGSAR